MRIEIDREDDGRGIAEVPELPGVMVYGTSREEAISRVKALALRVLADRLDNGEEIPATPCGICDTGMTQGPSMKARLVFAALLRIGWTVKRQAGRSHKVLCRPGRPDFAFAFHDRDEIGPHLLSRIARHTGLKPDDLRSAARSAQRIHRAIGVTASWSASFCCQ